MSSLSNFLQEALTIDQQESLAQDNYNYEKAQLGEMYDEQSQQLKDSALQALPFGISEATRAVGNLWGTGKAIYAFKQKYSPQIEAFAKKASDAYENIGKEGGAAVDYAELLKSAGTSLGNKALQLAAPKVLERTGIDLNKAVQLSKGEGGIQAGLASIQDQALAAGKTTITGLYDEGVSRVYNTVNAAAAKAEQAVSPFGVENAANPQFEGGTRGGREITNPLFEGETNTLDTYHAEIKDVIDNPLASESVKALATRADRTVEAIKAGKQSYIDRYAVAKGNLEQAQQRVADIKSRAPTTSDIRGGDAMYPASRGKTPSVRVSPELEAANAEVARHTASIEAIQNEAAQYKQAASQSLESLKISNASSLADIGETASTLKEIGASALSLGKSTLGVGLEAAGAYGGYQSVRDLISTGGKAPASQTANDVIGTYQGARSVQSLGGQALDRVKSLTGGITAEAKGKAPVPAEGAAAKVEEQGIKAGTSEADAQLEALADKGVQKIGTQIGEKLGVGLAEEGAEIGAAAAGASLIPVVGEAVDLGLGLYSAISSIIDIFKSPPKPPPPPPPPAQQAIQISHQQGIY